MNYTCLHILLITCIAIIASYDNVTDHPNWNLIPTKNCGKGKLSDRIVGGEVAALGQFPWMARLGYKLEDGINFQCAGSLITETIVVTAAHCVSSQLKKKLAIIRLGENDSDEEIDCEKGVCAPKPQDIRIQRVVLHDDYHYVTFQKDIALIFLEEKADLNGYVMPICLPQGPLLDPNYNLTGTVEVAGWGDVDSFDSHFPSRLRYVAMQIQDNSICVSYNPDNDIDESQYCVGRGDGKDSCVGDSGGPMMQVVSLKAPPRYFLFGVVSYGAAVCGAQPAVYTNIPYYMGWILDNLTPGGFS